MLTRARTIAAAAVLLVVAAAATSVASAATPLSPSERSTLLSMREEEKLAHDVYIALAARWGDRVFANVARAEARHEQAVERALAAYGIADPTDGFAAGRFPSADFQKLYADLVAEGSASRAAALGVGMEIERLDIADLRAAIQETNEPTLDRMYGNLLAASQRHLAAFERVAAGAVMAGPAAGSGGQQRGRGPGC